MAESASQTWFPDFCRLPAVFAVAVLVELVAVVTVLAQREALASFWNQLSLVSLFVQWLGLICAGSLCSLRGALSRFSPLTGLTLAWLLVLAITALGSVVGLWVGENILASIGPATGWAAAVSGNVMIAALVAAGALRYFYMHQQWQRSVEAQAESRVRALQARIRPHFLFNSMNTIASLIRSRPEVAEQTVEDLAELFRRSLGQNRGQIPLAEELRLTRRYLAIEELRLGDRLSIDWKTDALPGDQLVPPLILQPLVENAVYHGIEPRADGGRIGVSATADSKHWQITLRNPRAGDVERQRQGNGMALDNIRERLAHFYNGQAEMLVEESDSHFTMTVRAPIVDRK